MKFFKQHGLNHIWAQPNLIVPKMKNLPEHYRLSFGTSGQDEFNKEVEKTIQPPKEDDLFGTSGNEDDEIEEVPDSPPKKKVKKVRLIHVKRNLNFLN